MGITEFLCFSLLATMAFAGHSPIKEDATVNVKGDEIGGSSLPLMEWRLECG